MHKAVPHVVRHEAVFVAREPGGWRWFAKCAAVDHGLFTRRCCVVRLGIMLGLVGVRLAGLVRFRR